MKENKHREMSAQEMFESLGYKYTKEIIFPEDEDNRQSAIVYTKKDYKDKYIIEFFLTDKIYRTYMDCHAFKEPFELVEIDMSTFKAIYQQVKELGWLEE